MKNNWKQNTYIKLGLTAFIVIAASILFYMVLSHLTDIGDAVSTVLGVLMPFAVGLTLAYVLAPLYDFVEKPLHRLFAGKGEKPRRFAGIAAGIIASSAAMLVLLALVAGLLGMVIPQLIESITRLVEIMPQKTAELMEWIRWVNSLFSSDPTVSEWVYKMITSVSDSLMQWTQTELLPNLGNIVTSFTFGLIDVVSTLTNIGIGLVICIYTLNSKHLFAAQCKKLTYSLFKTQNANYIINTTRYVHRTFGSFINGKLLDSLLIGVLCFIGMSILQIPYALLVSAVVGLFNIVPIFGPIIGAAVGAVLVLIENPLSALIFLIFVVILQQIDGNIIGPKILGETTGLSSFWVVFAIVVGGGLFGFVGMVLGVPAFAVIYAFVNRFLERRLKKKHMSDNTEDYYDLREVDGRTGEPLYGLEKVDKVPVRDPSDDEQ